MSDSDIKPFDSKTGWVETAFGGDVPCKHGARRAYARIIEPATEKTNGEKLWEVLSPTTNWDAVSEDTHALYEELARKFISSMGVEPVSRDKDREVIVEGLKERLRVSEERNEEMLDRIESVEKENKDLEEKVAVLQSGAAMDQKTIEHRDIAIRKLNSEAESLRDCVHIQAGKIQELESHKERLLLDLAAYRAAFKAQGGGK